MSATFLDLDRSRLRAPRRRRRRRQRRVLRAEGEPAQAAAAPIWREGEYTDRGKWMDGWETRRRRDVGPSHDWCIVRLGVRGRRPRRRRRHRVLHRATIPESCAIDVCDLPACRRPRRSSARRGARCCRARRSTATRRTSSRSPTRRRATHLRLRIFPDGGVARLRVHGEVVADWDAAAPARRRRSRGRRARRPRRRVQRHVLRLAAQPDHARRRDAHGRRLGDEAPPRPGPRLDDRPARRGRARSGASRSTRATSRATRRAPAASRLRRDAADARARRRGASCCRARRFSRMRGTTFEDELRRRRRRHARAAQHLSGRRRRARFGCSGAEKLLRACSMPSA